MPLLPGEGWYKNTFRVGRMGLEQGLYGHGPHERHVHGLHQYGRFRQCRIACRQCRQPGADGGKHALFRPGITHHGKAERLRCRFNAFRVPACDDRNMLDAQLPKKARQPLQRRTKFPVRTQR